MASFLRNLELWLTLAGLFVVWAAVALLGAEGAAAWKVAAVVAVAVSGLHGAIFWLVRRRQRQVRAAALREVQEMLADRVKNPLAVVALHLPSPAVDPEGARAMADAREAVDDIERLVDSLSDESLTAWRRRYEASRATGALGR